MIELSSQQLAAVHAPLHQPVVVLAGPGSGKTTVLTHRLVWMVKEQHIPAKNILAVTFGSHMAEEILHRAASMNTTIPPENISTIHAFCLRSLKFLGDTRHKADNWTIRDAIQKELDSLSWNAPISAVRWWVERSKQDGIMQDRAVLASYFIAQMRKVGMSRDDALNLTYCTQAVNDRLRQDNTLLFADMVNDFWWKLQHDDKALDMIRDRYQYILVDEGQDTFELAVKVLRKIAPKNFFIVGDNDQLLFRYTGSSPEVNLYRTAQDGKLLKLEENRRSVPDIVSAASRLIGFNYGPETQQFRKKLVAVKGRSKLDEPAIVVRASADADDEADWIANRIESDELPYQQVFIGARTNAQLANVERALAKKDIPYVVTGNAGFFKRHHVQVVMAYLTLALVPEDDRAFEKVYNISSKFFTDGSGKRIGHRYLGTKFLGELSQAKHRMHGLRQGQYSRRFERGARDLLVFMDRLHVLIYNKHTSASHVLRVIVDDSYLPHYQVENGIQSLDPSSEDNVYDDLMVLIEMSQDYEKPIDFLGFVNEMVEKENDYDAARKVVEISTVHRLKGRERDYVFAMGWSEGLLPHSRALGTFKLPQIEGMVFLPILNDSGVSDERCIAFVEITRARKRVYISHIRTWNGKDLEPSRFIKELGHYAVEEKQNGDSKKVRI